MAFRLCCVVKSGARMDDAKGSLLLAMAVELAGLRQQLAQAQDLLVETAIDAGHLHAQIEHLQDKLAEAHAHRDVGRARAEQVYGMTEQAGAKARHPEAVSVERAY